METLLDLLDLVARRDRPVLLRARRDGGIQTISTARFLQRVDACARGLASMGVGRGDRVGLICGNRPEWHTVDFACHRLGAVLVPLFPTLTPSGLRFNVEDSGCRVLVVEDAEQLAKVRSVRDELPDLHRVVIIDATPDTGSGASANDLRGSVAGGDRGGASDEPGADGSPTVEADPLPFDRLLAERKPDDVEAGATAEFPGPEGPSSVATIIYTSGTTGKPKGVMLTHRNLVSNVEGVLDRLGFATSDCGLSLLPLCHVFERTVDYAYLAGDAAIVYSSPDRVADDLRQSCPTVMVGVPRLYEKIRTEVRRRAREAGGIRSVLYRWAIGVGTRVAKARRDSGRPTWRDRVQHLLADLLVLRRIRRRISPELRFFCSGGAALDPGLNWWFEALGFKLVQGYGLTESSPVIAVNPLEDNRIGTVGPPLRDVEVKIAEDGEILTRGPHVMRGYWNRPEATREVIDDDGWLHTGDVGELDDGYLRVTDRKKSILVTSTGKNVAPQPVENAVTESPFVDQVTMVGDGRKFLAGLIVPDFDALTEWSRGTDLPGSREELCRHPEVRRKIQEELDRTQNRFSDYERIREFRLLPERFSIEDGTLTPTLKVVRRAVRERYREEIDEIYRQAEETRDREAEEHEG